MLKIDGFDEAIAGVALVWANQGREYVLVYNAEEIRKQLMRDGMTPSGAREYIEFNIEGAYHGPQTPILFWPDDNWGVHD